MVQDRYYYLTRLLLFVLFVGKERSPLLNKLLLVHDTYSDVAYYENRIAGSRISTFHIYLPYLVIFNLTSTRTRCSFTHTRTDNAEGRYILQIYGFQVLSSFTRPISAALIKTLHHAERLHKIAAGVTLYFVFQRASGYSDRDQKLR